jgi:hypothetical protein
MLRPFWKRGSLSSLIAAPTKTTATYMCPHLILHATAHDARPVFGYVRIAAILCFSISIELGGVWLIQTQGNSMLPNSNKTHYYTCLVAVLCNQLTLSIYSTPPIVIKYNTHTVI